ncbi:hypothetical protein RIF25_08195 [Thermosynechococcaceae cyanobacterium BACA0444]|uniref:Transmembrane protein n=1 Tax=Pseudocalidococcus azoricus BACA0444 TaxID=2918990 RepID=A0AAE4FR78_9CYAN|nr:hypothetical protein [Pseudocalidococcus azoricus]MDS3860794.1 hypothetical protein [Pseudocalidococcus azoricus BACA0444]
MMPPEDSHSSQLSQFLHRHRPVPPPALGDLETQIMGQVLREAQTSKGQRVWLWGLLSLLLVGSGGLVMTQLLRPQALTASELSELDLYVAERWESLFSTAEESMPTTVFSSSLD